MVDVSTAADQIEERSDLGNDDAGIWQYWQVQEAIAEREERTWVKRARRIVKRYRDERPEQARELHRYNILWSNVQTLLPVLYARTPKPDVDRRFKDTDDVALLASTLLERSISYSLDAYDFDDVMQSVVEDRLLPGRGVARVLYVPHFGEPIRDETNAQYETSEDAPAVVDGPGDDGAEGDAAAATPAAPGADDPREVTYEEVLCKYIFWEDYREGAARKWDEVPWVRYRSYLSRDELVARFGKKKGAQVNLDYSPKGGPDATRDDPPKDIYKKAVVHEYWDKPKKQVTWVAPGTPDLVLDKLDDPLRLPGFFPNPNPLLATTTNDKRIPVPDYIEYQDQAREMDTLTARIERLEKALKVAGVYPGAEKQVLQQLVDSGTENLLIPVEDWAMHAGDRGGLKNMIEWLPIEQIAAVLVQLYSARDKVKQTIYEITGIGDIMRGNTDPRETMGAQQLKANFVTRRILPQQKQVARFARDMIRLQAAVIAEHFSPKTISIITGYPQLKPVPPMPQPPQAPLPSAMPPQVDPQSGHPAPDPQMAAYQQAMEQYKQAVAQVQAVQQANQQLQAQFDQAVALMRQDALHLFRVDIEADSTVAPDEEAEKQARVEFLQQIVPFLEQTVPIAQGNPSFAELLNQIGLFAVRSFKVSRPLEEAFEKFFGALGQMPPPPPKGGKGQGAGGNVDSPADLALRKQELDGKTQVAQQANAIKAQQVQGQLQIEAAKAAQQAQLDASRLSLEQQALEDERAFRAAREQSMLVSEARGIQ